MNIIYQYFYLCIFTNFLWYKCRIPIWRSYKRICLFLKPTWILIICLLQLFVKFTPEPEPDPPAALKRSKNIKTFEIMQIILMPICPIFVHQFLKSAKSAIVHAFHIVILCQILSTYLVLLRGIIKMLFELY